MPGGIARTFLPVPRAAVPWCRGAAVLWGLQHGGQQKWHNARVQNLPKPSPLSDHPWSVRGRGVTPFKVVDDLVLCLKGDRQVYAGPAAEAPRDLGQVFEWDGLILPGLVDVHCHGGAGASFPDATTPEQVMTAVSEHLHHGTTSLLASLVTDTPEVLLQRTALLAEMAAAGEIAGIHLEGPFLSAARCGAQDPGRMQVPNAALVAALAKAGNGYLATMTLAPELAGTVGPGSVIEALANVGALPSFGHTDASATQMTQAVDYAAKQLAGGLGQRGQLPTATHLFNGMRPIHHRDPGPALACLAEAARGRMVVELIADGVHLDPVTVAKVFDLVGADHVVLITDAMAAAGLGDGVYQLGPQAVQVAGGVARLVHGDSIAGGVAHLMDVVRGTVLVSGVELAAAVRSASLVPARLLGLENEIGSLGAGLRADFVLTDQGLSVNAVYRAGQKV